MLRKALVDELVLPKRLLFSRGADPLEKRERVQVHRVAHSPTQGADWQSTLSAAFVAEAGSKPLTMTSRTQRPSVLVVDDERTIVQTLVMILEQNGFEVSSACSVPEALDQINSRAFDILLSDLNIGQPGDGFTLASTMRRRWPKALTLILTGYPDFETALEAIRRQVDDYLIKPIEPALLLSTLQTKLQTPSPERHSVPSKRVADVIRENRNAIIAEWLKRIKSHPEFQSIRLSDDELTDHLPPKLDELIVMLESHPEETTFRQLSAAYIHGKTRRRHNFSSEMLVEESRVLESCIFDAIQQNLLKINMSVLIPDLIHVSDSNLLQMRETVRGSEGKPPAKAAQTHGSAEEKSAAEGSSGTHRTVQKRKRR